MLMTTGEIRIAVMESLKKFMGDDEQVMIDSTTRPIGDLDMTSEDGIAWATELEDVGIIIPENVNPFVDDEQKRARSVDEIVTLLAEFLE